MQKKKKSLGRVTLLYCLFFGIVAICALMSFSEIIRTGQKDAMRIAANTSGQEVSMIYDLPIATSESDFNISLETNKADNTEVNARASRLDVEVASDRSIISSGMRFSIAALMFLAYLAIFVLMLLIINSLRRSIKHDDNTFSKQVIMMTRGIGILLIMASLLSSLAMFIECSVVSRIVDDPSLKIDTSFQFNMQELVSGIMIFVIAEVFSIGNRISEEQKYTI